MNIDQFKPDDTGKFSPLLYNFLKRNEKFGKLQVWQHPINEAKDEYSDDFSIGQIIIATSSDYCVFGRSLGSIIRGERGCNKRTFAFGIKMFGLRNVTESFWVRYASAGRCVWDERHERGMVGDDNRFTFTEDGLTRTCNWCGKVHHGTKRVRVERHRYIEWKDAA